MKKICLLAGAQVLAIFLLSCKEQEIAAPDAGISLSGGKSVQLGAIDTADSLDAFKTAILNKINEVRTTGCKCGGIVMKPVGALVWNDLLLAAAAAHAADMRENSYFSHISSDGRTAKDRIKEAGYTLYGYRSLAIGENIARGQFSVDQVVNDWVKSPSHCSSLMSATFTDVAVARDGTYWVQDLGGRATW